MNKNEENAQKELGKPKEELFLLNNLVMFFVIKYIFIFIKI